MRIGSGRDPSRILPVRSPQCNSKKSPAKASEFPYNKKAYIPVPREQQYVAHTTNNEKEVITTSKKNNKVAGAKNASANDKSAAKDSKAKSA
ncbi:MAG: hypothetical protein LUQ31_11195 [Methanoregula sp.]|nr:hypothetical protein [Methanoregula sp.]